MFKLSCSKYIKFVNGSVSSGASLKIKNGYFCIYFCDYDNQGNETTFALTVHTNDVNKLIVTFLLNSNKWYYLKKVVPITKFEYEMFDSRKHA